jgi:hypothetical protein
LIACERVSVVVVVPAVLGLTIYTVGSDVHRDFGEIAVCVDGKVRFRRAG